jgi:hypothetical protein
MSVTQQALLFRCPCFFGSELIIMVGVAGQIAFVIEVGEGRRSAVQ